MREADKCRHGDDRLGCHIPADAGCSVFHPMKFATHSVDAEGWTKWIRPRQKLYRMRCCDCDLVHDMQFKQLRGYTLFRARRNEELTSDSRAKQKLKKDIAQKAAQTRADEKARKEAERQIKETTAARALSVGATWYKVPCPYCKAKVGYRCTRSGGQENGWIHVARIAAGKAKVQRLRTKSNNRNGSRRVK